MHAFADSKLGVFFLDYMLLVLGASLYLIIDRLPYLKSERRLDSLLSRESAFLFNNLLLLVACFAVLWGTMFPVLSNWVEGTKITVGPPFFNNVGIPIVLMLLLLTGVGPLFAWRKTSVESLKKAFLWPVILALLLCVVLLAAGMRSFYVLASFTGPFGVTMDPLLKADYGHALNSVDICRGLRELNADLTFDPGGNLGIYHPRIDHRMGVYYNGLHICGLDRGTVPEYKIRSSVKTVVDLPWSEADREDACISYREILPTDPQYAEFYAKGLKGNDPEFFIRPRDRKLLRCVPRGYATVAHRVERVGWRHTFDRIIAFGVPGITRESIAATFGVDMLKIPVGTPEEILAAVGEE